MFVHRNYLEAVKYCESVPADTLAQYRVYRGLVRDKDDLTTVPFDKFLKLKFRQIWKMSSDELR